MSDRAAYMRVWRRRHPGYNQRYPDPEGDRRRNLWRLYKITPEEFDAKLEEQGGVCAICLGGPKDVRGYHADHCHKTGRFRGVLCNHCNSAIALLGEDAARFLRALAYLGIE